MAESCVDSDFKAEELTSCFDRKHWERWIKSVKGIDFTHSSRKVLRTFNHLSGHCACPRQCPVTANTIAHQLLANGHYAGASKAHSLNVKQQCSALRKSQGVDSHLTTTFTSKELAHTIKLLKSRKVHGPDNIPPEFLNTSKTGVRCIRTSISAQKTTVFGCLTNALAPLPIALESCSWAQTDRPV